MSDEDDDLLDAMLDEALDDFEKEEEIAMSPRTSTRRQQQQQDSMPPLGTDAVGDDAAAEEMLRQFEEAFGSVPEGMEGEEDLQAALEEAFRAMSVNPEVEGELVENFLQEILSPDVLAEPLRDMMREYPPWLEEHADSIEEEERVRYQEQYEMVVKICAAYDAKKDFEHVAVLMEQLSAMGNPPPGLLKKLVPDMPLDEHGQPKQECSVM